MKRMLALAVVSWAACVAFGDELILQDGRVFTGTVTVKGESVIIEMPYGTLSFKRDEVLRVELKDTPLEEYTKRLRKVSTRDAEALFALSMWARTNGLEPQAKELLAKVLELSSDHQAARKACGFARIENQWISYKALLQLAQGRLAGGQLDSLRNDILPALESLATKEDAILVQELKGTTHLQSKDFAAAAQIFADLAARSAGPVSLKYSAIAEILSANRDGMYILTEPYPPHSVLLDTQQRIQAGPASLAQPLVLEAALRDRSKVEIKTGRELMEAASKLEATDPDSALAKYAASARSFDKADALVDGIAGSYRIEIARRRIAAIRRDADADARKFDGVMTGLGRKDLQPQAYRAFVLKMIHSLDSVRDSLKNIVDIAKPHSRELILEMEWAQKDLRRIEAMRTILTAELDAKE